MNVLKIKDKEKVSKSRKESIEEVKKLTSLKILILIKKLFFENPQGHQTL